MTPSNGQHKPQTIHDWNQALRDAKATLGCGREPTWAEASIEWIEDGAKITIRLRDNDDDRLYQRIAKIHKRARETETGYVYDTKIPTPSPPEAPVGQNGKRH